MFIRPLKKTEIDTVIQLQKSDGYPHQYYLTKDRVEKLINKGELFFLILSSEGTPVGFASIDLEIRAKLHFICVDKEFGKQGYGSVLMHQLLNEAKKSGYKRVCSYVEAGSNKETFLKKFHFEQVGYYKNRYGNGVDASIWELLF